MTHLVLFTRDLRVRDHPGLAAAGPDVVTLFVHDERVARRAGPHRGAALAAALADLDHNLQDLGGRLIERSGDPATVVRELVAAADVTDVHVTADVSRFARRREQALARVCDETGTDLHVHEGVTVLPPGAITPQGTDHYRVFTPYWKRWRTEIDLGTPLPVPPRLEVPADIDGEDLPGATEPLAVPVTETDAHARLDELVDLGADPDHDADRLDRRDSARLSAALHLGTLSAADAARWALEHDEQILRQLCWRDLFHQLLAANPDLPDADLRDRQLPWSDDASARERWRDGNTGIPIVDAAMRELLATGWMHNRTRMIVGSFLTKSLGEHWSHGAAHFEHWLVDADTANNVANWQWIAGTGTDTRPNRVLNPVRQARRFDPDGTWVRRWVPELAHVEGRAVHEPWKLDANERGGYPDPMIEA